MITLIGGNELALKLTIELIGGKRIGFTTHHNYYSQSLEVIQLRKNDMEKPIEIKLFY